MYTQFFGNYLLDQGLITIDQLREALEIQDQVRLKLGVLAINAGYMNANQVQEVHNQQAKVDKRMGEIAVELGFLTSEQVDNLLGSQQSGYLLLGQALVDKKYITNEQFEVAINGYKAKYKVNGDNMDSPSEADEMKIIDSYFKFDDDVDEEYKIYLLILFRNIIRFVGTDFTPVGSKKIEQYDAVNLAYQIIQGEDRLYTAVDAKDDAFVVFASRFACEKITSVDELAEDSVSEFMNLSNGLYTVNRSAAGIELKMLPQRVKKGAKLTSIEKGYVIDVVFGFGLTHFIICK